MIGAKPDRAAVSEDRDNHHAEESASSSAIATNLGWLFTRVILYVLSVGPAILVYDGLPRPAKNVVQIVYAPVIWLAESPVGKPIEWYGNLWERL